MDGRINKTVLLIVFFAEAQNRVEEMEKERRKLDRQLNLAQEKTRKANIGQEVLEAKIKVKEQESIMEKEGSLSRMTSLNPSASFYVRNRHAGSTMSCTDRPSYMPMRSASMRETSYSRSIRRRGQRTNNNLGVAAVNNGVNGGSSLSVSGRANSAVVSQQSLVIEEVQANGQTATAAAE